MELSDKLRELAVVAKDAADRIEQLESVILNAAAANSGSGAIRKWGVGAHERTTAR